MFSLEDIIKLSEILIDHEGQITQELVSKVFSSLTVKQETGTETYAIKVDNYFQFIDYINRFFQLSDSEKERAILNLKNKYRQIYYSAQTNDADKYLKELFSFMDSNNLMGLSIYRSTDEDFSNWEKMNYDHENEELTPSTPCSN